MTPILSYLLKANITLFLLYGFYFLCFRRDTFYGHIRWYLLATILSAMIFPMIDISSLLSVSQSAVSFAKYVPNVDEIYQYVFVHPQISQSEYHTVDTKFFSFVDILFWIWFIPAIIMFGRRLFQIACIVCLSVRHSREGRIITIDGNTQPFSFFGFVFLNPSLYSKDDLDEIVAHEQIHCRQGHTIDILMVETLVCVFWFNPVAWLLRLDIKQNLEYYTDRAMLAQGFDCKRYQYNLLRVSVQRNNKFPFQIVNHFIVNHHYNHLKNRIVMINQSKSPRILTAKYLLVVPVLAAVLTSLQVSNSQAGEINYVADNIIKSKPDSMSKSKINYSVEVSPNDTLRLNCFDNVIREIVVDSRQKVNVVMDPDGQVKEAILGLIPCLSKMPAVSLYIVDNVEVSSLSGITPERIQSITILKDKTAIEQYGEKAKNGVVILITKKDNDNDFKKSDMPLYIVGGEVVSSLSGIAPEHIESISILKGQKAIEQYGDKGKNGVVIIDIKKIQIIPY